MLSRLIRFFHIAFPLAMLALAVAEVVFHLPITTYMLAFTADFIFLRASHVAITFVFLAAHPNFKRWVTAEYSRPLYFYLQMAGLGAVFFLLQAASMLDPGDSRALLVVSIAVPVLINLWSSYHAVMQTYGLFTQYEVNELPKGGTRQFEKYVFLVFFLVYGFALVGGRYTKVPMPATARGLFLAVQFPLCLVLWLFLLARVLRTGLRQRTERALFIGRLLLYPLSFTSNTALFAASAYHGVEHVFVTDQMLTNTERNRARLAALSMLACLFISFCGTIVLIQKNKFVNFQPDMVIPLTSFIWSLSLLHFYLEGQIFRMKRFSSRAEIAPLLRAPARA